MAPKRSAEDCSELFNTARSSMYLGSSYLLASGILADAAVNRFTEVRTLIGVANIAISAATGALGYKNIKGSLYSAHDSGHECEKAINNTEPPCLEDPPVQPALKVIE